MKSPLSTTPNVLSSWPTIQAKNASTTTATDGTPNVADFWNTRWALEQALLHRAGITPSGTVELYTPVGSGNSSGVGAVTGDPAQQQLWAMQRHFGMPGDIVLSFKNATAMALSRELLLTGGAVDGFLYPDLWYNTWVGSAANGTAPYFYTTSDSNRTTRATTGLTVYGVTGGRYLVIPDCRGLIPRGLGTSSSKTAANGTLYTGGTSMAQVLTDQLAGHKHYLESSGISFNFDSVGASNTGGSTGYPTNGAGNTRAGTIVTDGTNGPPNFGYETRGASFACNIAIRY